MIYVVTHPGSKALFQVGKLFNSSFEDNGYDTRHIKTKEVHKVPGDIVFVIGAGRFPNFNKKQKRSGTKYVLWNSEPFPTTKSELKQTKVYNSRFQNKLKRLLPAYDMYFDYLPSQYNYMNHLGIKCDGWCPIGYHKTLDFTDKYKEDLEYDVLFMGSFHNTRRTEIFKKIARGCKAYPSTRGLYGEERIKATFKCKIGLNIHYELLDTYEQLRIMELLSSKRLIVSEPISDPILLTGGKHFVEATRQEFVEKVLEVAKNYPKYRHIAEQGYDFIKTECRFNDSTKKMMEIILSQ